ncbi:hypothetical protein BH10PSE17_BH10PSE17_36170 [soil metagenome]
MSDQSSSTIPLHSPFALMDPCAVDEILVRAERMNLPRRLYSPLSEVSIRRHTDVEQGAFPNLIGNSSGNYEAAFARLAADMGGLRWG